MMRTQTENTLNAQLVKAAGILQDLDQNITKLDRKAALRELNVVEATVRRYLKGKGTDIDTALRIIDFFKKRIEERERKLNEVA